MANKIETFPSLNSIASRFGFHRNTVGKWFAHSDAPKRGPKGYDFDQVAEFLKACAEREKSQAKTDPKMAQAKLDEVIQRVRKLTRLNDEAEGKLVRVADMENQIRQMANACQRLLNDLPSRMAPSLAGLPIVEVHKRLEKAVLEVQYALCAGGSPEACRWAQDELEHARRTPREQWPDFPVRTDGYSDRLKQLTDERAARLTSANTETAANAGDSGATPSPR